VFLKNVPRTKQAFKQICLYTDILILPGTIFEQVEEMLNNYTSSTAPVSQIPISKIGEVIQHIVSRNEHKEERMTMNITERHDYHNKIDVEVDPVLTPSTEIQAPKEEQSPVEHFDDVQTGLI